jgi:Lrp/AsnC family leucine-responsive transcriptional regulator
VETPKLDEIDCKILEILQKDGRITNARLAKEVGLSAPPMLERVKKLERNGIIQGFRAILDARRLGRAMFVFVALNLDIKALAEVDRIEAQFTDMPEILESHHIAGEIDLLLKVNVVDQEHFKQFVIGTLAKIEGINRIQSWVVLGTSKNATELSIPS